MFCSFKKFEYLATTSSAEFIGIYSGIGNGCLCCPCARARDARIAVGASDPMLKVGRDWSGGDDSWTPENCGCDSWPAAIDADVPCNSDVTRNGCEVLVLVGDWSRKCCAFDAGNWSRYGSKYIGGKLLALGRNSGAVAAEADGPGGDNIPG